MSHSMHSFVHDRQAVMNVPDDVPDGTRVELRFVPVADQIGMDDSQWRDDAEAIKEWNIWLRTITPIDFAEPDEFDRKFAEFNIQAVREQMSEDGQ